MNYTCRYISEMGIQSNNFQAEKMCSRSAYEPGFNYCMGLYKRYNNYDMIVMT